MSFHSADLSTTRAIEDIRTDQNMSLHPYFDYDVARNVTARLGQTAFLHCRVEQLGDKSVSKMNHFKFFFLPKKEKQKFNLKIFH